MCAALSRECVWGSADCSPRYEFRSGLKSTKFAIAGAKRKQRNFIEICHARVEIMASKFSMAAIRNSDKPQEAMRRGDGRPCTAHVAPSDAAFPRPYLIHMNGPSRISRGLHMITILHVPHDCMIIACLLKCLFNYMHSSSQVPAVSCLLLPVDRTTAVSHRVTTQRGAGAAGLGTRVVPALGAR